MGQLRRPAGLHVLVATTVLYAVCVVAWQVIRLTAMANWWLFQLVAPFDFLLYLPLPLLAVALVLRRDWRYLAYLAVPLLVLLWDYGPLFLPRAASTQDTTFRVMTANLAFTNWDSASIGRLVLDWQPDVIAVQELGTKMSAPLAETLRERYPYQLLYPSTSTRGMGVFSRYPIRSSTEPQMGSDACSCQQVSIDLAGRPITLLNVHPHPAKVLFKRVGPIPVPVSLSPDELGRSLLRILERADAVAQPLLIAGDFNVSDRQPGYRLVSSRFGDSHREAGWGLGYTFPDLNLYGLPLRPFMRIDYVFHDGAWTAGGAWTAILPGSDHRTVLADLALLP